MRVARVVERRVVTYHLAEPFEVTVVSGRGMGATTIRTDAIRVVSVGTGQDDVRAWDGGGGGGAWLNLTESSERAVLAALEQAGYG